MGAFCIGCGSVCPQPRARQFTWEAFGGRSCRKPHLHAIADHRSGTQANPADPAPPPRISLPSGGDQACPATACLPLALGKLPRSRPERRAPLPDCIGCSPASARTSVRNIQCVGPPPSAQHGILAGKRRPGPKPAAAVSPRRLAAPGDKSRSPAKKPTIEEGFAAGHRSSRGKLAGAAKLRTELARDVRSSDVAAARLLSGFGSRRSPALGDVRRDAPRLFAGEWLGRRAPSQLVREVALGGSDART